MNTILNNAIETEAKTMSILVSIFLTMRVAQKHVANVNKNTTTS